MPREHTAKPADYPEAAAYLTGGRSLKVPELGKRIVDVDEKSVVFSDGEPKPHETLRVVRTRVGMRHSVADEDSRGLCSALTVPRPSEHGQSRPGV
ncbi:hypothetical protein OG612_29540 [Streptomyces sp. NBC_01527]|uniref:hypothetical protein n=1 Tax=Streptomyces sp. NBC_01527 TaxID=2903894 RepID=UPI00386D9676